MKKKPEPTLLNCNVINRSFYIFAEVTWREWAFICRQPKPLNNRIDDYFDIWIVILCARTNAPLRHSFTRRSGFVYCFIVLPYNKCGWDGTKLGHTSCHKNNEFPKIYNRLKWIGSNETLFDDDGGGHDGGSDKNVAHTKWQTDKSLVICSICCHSTQSTWYRAENWAIEMKKKRIETRLPNKHFALCRSNIWKCWLTPYSSSNGKQQRQQDKSAPTIKKKSKEKSIVKTQGYSVRPVTTTQLVDIQTDMCRTPDLIYILMRWINTKMKEI